MIIKGLVLAAITSLCYGTEMAKIQANSKTIVTSSTLSWQSGAEGLDEYENGVPVEEGGPLWCRGKKHAMWIAGSVINGKCNVPFLSSVVLLDTYDILVSTNGLARVKSIPWDKYTSMPHNAVATPDRLLATSIEAENTTLMAGYISTQERSAFLLSGDDKGIQKETKAMVVTEVEPVRYKLDNVVMDQTHSQKGMEDTVVAEIVLENKDDVEQTVKVSKDYTDVKLYYWGNVKGTITARPAMVNYPSHVNTEIVWNIENEMDQSKTQEISYLLPAGTAVKVQLVSRVQKYEAPYTGTLTAIYKDGETISRTIKSLHMDFQTLELRAEYAQPYIIQNETYLTDIEPYTEILVHSTTTTTTTTTPRPEPPEEQPQPDSLASGGSNDKVSEKSTSASSALTPSLVLYVGLVIQFFKCFFN